MGGDVEITESSMMDDLIPNSSSQNNTSSSNDIINSTDSSNHKLSENSIKNHLSITHDQFQFQDSYSSSISMNGADHFIATHQLPQDTLQPSTMASIITSPISNISPQIPGPSNSNIPVSDHDKDETGLHHNRAKIKPILLTIQSSKELDIPNTISSNIFKSTSQLSLASSVKSSSSSSSFQMQNPEAYKFWKSTFGPTTASISCSTFISALESKLKQDLLQEKLISDLDPNKTGEITAKSYKKLTIKAKSLHEAFEDYLVKKKRYQFHLHFFTFFYLLFILLTEFLSFS